MYSIAILSTLLSTWLMFADTLPDFRFDFFGHFVDKCKAMRWSQYWFQHKVIPLILIGGLIFVNFFILVSEKHNLSDSGNDYVSSS